MIRRVLSNRVLGAAAVFCCLLAFDVLVEPDRPPPEALLPPLAAAVSELEVQFEGKQALYRRSSATEEFDLAGPPAVVADEKRIREEADRKAREEISHEGLVGHKIPSVWRRQRLAAMVADCLRSVRDDPVERLPAPQGPDRDLFGIDRPQLTVRVRAGQTYEIRVGGRAPGGYSRYVHCPQSRAFAVIGVDVVRRLERLALRSLPGD